MAISTFNVLGICAGVAGIELGLRIAVPGARPVCFVEREVYTAANLVAPRQWLRTFAGRVGFYSA